MSPEADRQSAVIRNATVEVRADVEDGTLGLQLAARDREGAFVPVLQRVGSNRTESPLQAEIPSNCRLAVESTARTQSLTIGGSVGPARLCISILLRGDSSWVEVGELLSLSPRRSLHLCPDGDPPEADEPTVTVDWFEAVWRFVGWKAPGEVFSPVLVPEDNDVIGWHVMRAPALTAQCESRAAALVSSVDSIRRIQALPACMNLLRDEGAPVLRTGLRPHRVRGHVYFEYAPAPAHQDVFHHAYQLYVSTDAAEGAAVCEASRRVWSSFGSRSSAAAPPMPLTYEEYAAAIYPRVIDQSWVETTLDGVRIGAIRLDRSYPRDIWMSLWFSQLRSAYGLFVWGQQCGKQDWVERALATRELHLLAPQCDGLFPTVFVFGDRPETCRWVGSHHQGGGPGIYHLMDMSWTAYQLLRWHRDLTADDRSIEFVRRYCRGIVALQREDGGLPAFVDADTRHPLARVDLEALQADLADHPGGDRYVSSMLPRWGSDRFVKSAEDSASLLALAECARCLPEGDPDRAAFLASAARIADWLEAWVYPEARWLDFEVHWSCSPKPLHYFDSRSGQWPQNTLCMHTAAAGMLVLYELTADARYLGLARRALARMSLYQQVWDPPFLNCYGFGGYGVMNTDGEWNDSRQGQFAETHLDFARALGDDEQRERAIAACRASFVTLYLPWASSLYPTGWARLPQGMAAENHGHGGRDELCGISGFDWGAGSALATAAYFRLRGEI